MPLSMSPQYPVPLCRRAGVLATYMDLAEQAAETRKFDPANLVGARLAPDMLPLSGQVQRASDTAKAAMGRLGGIAVPSFPDTEASLAELKQRLANTIAFLDTVEPAQLDGAGDKTIEIKIGGFALQTDRSGLRAFLRPSHTSLHVATAHAILRHNGVAVGKPDSTLGSMGPHLASLLDSVLILFYFLPV